MKVGWEIKTLGDVCERVTVGHVGITSPYYRDEGILFLRTQNVGNSGLVLDDRKYVTPEFHAALKKSEVKAGDILMSRVITHTVHCALIPPDLGPANCANVVLVRPASKLIPKFLVHYIRSSEAQRHLLDRKVGSAQLVVNTNVIKSWPVPVPSISEQHRIVAILDDAFDRIATAKANAEKNLQNARALFESHLQAVFSQTSKNWEKKHLAEVAKDFGRGKSKHRPRNDPKLYGGKYPFIQTGDVRNSTHLINTYSQTYNEVGLAQSKLWPKGTLCITIAANIAETGILDFDSCFPDSVIGIVVDPDEISIKFLEYLLQSFKTILQAKGKGSAQDNINLGTFENQLFPFPSLKIVSTLDSLSEDIQRLESIYQQKLTALDELKKSLLHQAFSGQL